MGSRDITFKKKKNLPKWFPAAVCIAAAVLIAAVCVTALAVKHNREKEKKKIHGGTWITEGYEKVTDAGCADEKFIVFTDSATGMKGIMNFDGKITEPAEHNEFSVCRDEWRHCRYTVKSPLSEYLLLVDPETLTVTTRQYHGVKEPEKKPCWNETTKNLVWADKLGFASAVKSGELELEAGLYPVATAYGDGAKYGYISENFVLEIATVYENAMDFSEGLAAVCKDGKWGYINENGVTVIPFEYESVSDGDITGGNMAWSFRNGAAPAKKNGVYGIINKVGDTVVDFAFECILQGENGKYLAKKDGVWGMITVTAISEEVEKQANQPTTTQAAEPGITAGTYAVSTSGSILNMRMSAQSGAAVVGKLPNGTVIEVIDSVPGWAYVTYGSTKGWVSSEFIKPYNPPATQAETTSAAAKTSTSIETTV